MWSPWKWGQDREIRRTVTDMIDGCEAFLAGSYREHLEARGRSTPDWVWMNVLAHGTVEELRQVAAGATCPERGRAWALEWHHAVAYLAAEVLDAAGGDEAQLRQIQHDRLLPVELALAAERDGRAPVPPAKMAGIVLAALRQHPSSYRGRIA